MNDILGKVNVGVSKIVGTCLISFFRCQSRHNGVTATEAQPRMRVMSPRSMPPSPRRVLPVRRMPRNAALRCEPPSASGRRSRRKSPRTDKALPTSDFNAQHAAACATAVDAYSPPPPRCIWLCASVRKFCWAMVLGCTRLIECSGYFFLVQLTLCTLYNLTKNTTLNVPTIQYNLQSSIVFL